MANFITGIITLSIGIILLANVFISTVHNTDRAGACLNLTSGTACVAGSSGVNITYPYAWSVAEIALWSTLALAGIAGVIYGTLATFGIA